MVLVSKPLNGDNYLTWHRATTISLNAKSKFDLLMKILTIICHKQTKKYTTWKQCNDMILTWILNSLTKVIFYDNAHEVWEDLQNCFLPSNAPHIFQLKKEIACLT